MYSIKSIVGPNETRALPSVIRLSGAILIGNLFFYSSLYGEVGTYIPPHCTDACQLEPGVPQSRRPG